MLYKDILDLEESLTMWLEKKSWAYNDNVFKPTVNKAEEPLNF